MDDRVDPPADGTSESEPHVFDLEAAEREPTGDPLVDSGMRLTLDEMEQALQDPDHPDHAAAAAANSYMSEKLGSFISTLYGDQFRRISENLSSALMPDLGNLFSVGKTGSPKSGPGAQLPSAGIPDVPVLEVGRPDETAQRTLETLLSLSERMSEMVRVSAEHRDVAVQQTISAQDEAKTARRYAKWMLWLSVVALIGTWAAVITALAA